jgi:hypothetical protein
MNTNEPTLKSLLRQYPIAQSIFRALGDSGVFLLRYVFKGIKRPAIHPLAAFMTEGDPRLVEWAISQHYAAGLPPKGPSWYTYSRALTNACKVAATLGRIEAVKVAAKDKPCKLNFETACAAAKARQSEIVRWMHETGRIAPVLPLSERDKEYKGEGTFKYKYEFGYCGKETHEECACTKWGEMVIANVAKTDDFELFRWLRERNYCCSARAQRAAAKRGDIPMLEYIRRKYLKYRAFDESVQNVARSTSVLNYLDVYGVVNGHAYKSAARRGLVEILDWLQSKGLVARREDMHEALKAGQKEAVMWFVNNGMRLKEDATAFAAQHSVEMVEWVMALGAPWSVHACPKGVNEGNYGIVDFAAERGLPFNRELCENIRQALEQPAVEYD